MLGQGDPVIVLEADSGAWSTSWDRLPERLSELSTVIVYDRAGLGWSEAGEAPRDPDTLARELHGLLRELAPERPVVLVAHGAGTRIAWSFAARYPFQLAGLVAVDGEHPSLATDLAEAGIPAPTISNAGLRLLGIAARLGVLRALGFTPPAPEGVSARTLDTLRAMGPRGLAAARAEESSGSAATAPQTALDIPVRVLVANASLPPQEGTQRYPHESYNRLWERAGRRLAEISSHSRVISVDGDHFFHVSRPQVVVQAVEDVLAASRS